MVYCGKPSRACQTCRERRIKCDEAKPTCTQCAKSRRHCPGYKDEFDLVFRNETKATERRAQKASKKAVAQKAARESARAATAVTTSVNTSGSWSVTASPGVSMAEQASCHFIANFVLMPKDGRTVGYLDYILPLLKEEGPDSPIQHAFNACSLAFLDNRRGVGSGCWDKALAEYTVALARTNAALRDRSSQQSDVTLAAVILLGLFESISAKQIDKIHWGSHIEGAVQLVKARGKRQTRTKRGLQLFIAVRTLMSIYCLTAQQAVNSGMGADWWIDNSTYNKMAAAVQRLMIRTGEVRSQVMHLIGSLTWSPDNAGLMLDMIRKAQAVEHEVVAWQQSVPEDWNARTVAWDDGGGGGDGDHDAEVFPGGRVDVYNDVWIGSVANSARAVRLILQSLIMRCVAWVCWPVDYRTTPEYATAAAVSRDAIDGIIASVPYFLGWNLKRGNKKKGRNAATGRQTESEFETETEATSFGTFACGQEDGTKGLAGYLLTWPLTCVASQDHTTDAQRTWVLGKLHEIGGVLGIKYAFAMAELHVRIPSMLIYRDAFARSQATVSEAGLELIAAVRRLPPSPVYALNPQQQWEAMQKAKTRADEG